MCAKYATPPPAPTVSGPSDETPANTCITNQKPISTNAGSGSGTRIRPMMTRTVARGKSTMYAPMTPEIAPLAPIAGVTESAFSTPWASAARTPASR